MRHILQGFTMHIEGEDFGYDTEEITIPIPTPKTQEYQGGGMDMAVNQPMGAIEALEVTVKMSGHNTSIMKRMAKGPGKTTTVHFRGAVLTERNGAYAAHVVAVEGCVNGGSRDTWQRGEKSGLEFVINGITFFQYEEDDTVIHRLSAWPPERVVNGVDELADIKRILG